MFATPFERAARRQVRARLRSSEILWREYLPRRRIERWRLVGQRFLVLMSPLMVATAIFAVFVAAVLQLGVGLLLEEGPLVGTDNGPLLPLAFNSVFLTGATLLGISALRSVLIRSKQLTWCAYYPVADSDFRRERVMKGAWFLFCGPLLTAPVYIWLAQGGELSIFGWLTLVAMAIAQGLVCGALVIVCVGYARKPWSKDRLAVSGVLFVFVGTFLAFGGAYLLVYERQISWAVFLLLPSGWINGAFHYGLLEGQSAAWLLLCPAIAVIAAAWCWLQSPYRVVEFTFPVPCEAEAEFAPSALCKPPASRWTNTEAHSAAGDFPAIASETDGLPGTITEQSLLALINGSRHGWIERFTIGRLTERQRLLIESRAGALDPWPLAWYAAALCLLLAGIPVPFHPRSDDLFSVFGFAGLFLATIDVRPDSPRFRSTHGWMDYNPVGFCELGSTVLRVASWRIVAIAPLALAAMVARCFLSGFAWYWAAARLIAAVVAVLALRATIYYLAVSERTNDTSHYRILALWAICVPAICGGSLAVAFAPSAIWSLAAAAIVALTAWLFGRYYARAFDRGDFDIVR
jgi:hypothetical protein